MDGTRRIKILYILNTFGIGGAERHYTELLKRISRSNFDVLACCLWKRGELLKELDNVDVDIVDLDLMKRYWQRLPLELWNLRRWIHRERVDIVHSYLFHSNIVGALAGRLSGVRVIVSKRALNTTWITRKHVMINRFVNRCADKITVVSDAVARSVMESEKVPAEKIVRIYNGVDFEKMSRRQMDQKAARLSLGIENGGPIIGTVAHLSKKKGHRYLLEAAREIVADFPDAVFLWAGEGELEGELRQLAIQWELAGNIRFLGYRLDVPSLLEALDMFVLPSVEEGMPNALLEAMAKKVPVVATDVGGNPEVVEHERSGILVPPQNASALAGGMMRILRQPSVAASMAEAGARRVRDRFRIEVMIQEIEQLYRDLMSRDYNSSLRQASPG